MRVGGAGVGVGDGVVVGVGVDDGREEGIGVPVGLISVAVALGVGDGVTDGGGSVAVAVEATSERVARRERIYGVSNTLLTRSSNTPPPISTLAIVAVAAPRLFIVPRADYTPPAAR